MYAKKSTLGTKSLQVRKFAVFIFMNLLYRYNELWI